MRRSPSPSQTYRSQSNILPRRSPSPSSSQRPPSREYVMRRSPSPSQPYRSQSYILPRRSPVGASPPLVVMPTPTHPLDRDVYLGEGRNSARYVGEVTVEMGRIYRAGGDTIPSPTMVYTNNNYLSYDELAEMDRQSNLQSNPTAPPVNSYLAQSNDELAGMEEDMEGDESGEVASEVRTTTTTTVCMSAYCLPICLSA